MSGQDRAVEAGRRLLGTAAPRLVLKTIDGDAIDLGSLYGHKAVYLKFWATWCVPCRQQMPHFEHAYESSGPDLAVIAINAGFNETGDEVRAYRTRLGLTMPVVIDDGRLAAALNLRVTPQHVVVGRDGRILYVGHLADEHLDAALVAARTTSGIGTAKALAAPRGAAAAPAVSVLRVGDRLPARYRDARLPGATALVFLSPWCESYLETSRPASSVACRHAREQVNALASQPQPKPPHLRWMGVASGLWASPEDLRKYQADYHVAVPLRLDASGAEFRAFQVVNVPTIILSDRDGTIVRRLEASDLEDQATLKDALNTLDRSPPGS